jgi:Leucine-rich repeat (LRR) protein
VSITSRPRLQFSLAACLIATSLAAIVIGRASNEAQRQARLVSQVELHGAKLTFQPRASFWARVIRPLRGMVHPEYFREVTAINLRHQSAPPELLEIIGRCRELRSLDLRACQVTDDGVALLTGLRQLESLDLSRNRISDASLPLIGRLTRIRHLVLSENMLGKRGVEHLAQLPQLYSLCLDRTQLGDDAMPWIGRMANLHNLQIAKTPVTDDGLSSLRTLRQLSRLRIGGGGTITERGLRSLRELPALSHLSLVELPLSDEQLIGLARLKQLKYLYLANREDRLSAVYALERLRPDLVIQQTVVRP